MALIPSARPSLTIGGRVFTDLSTNLIALFAYIDSSSKRSVFRRNNNTSGYQVTAAKTLQIWAARFTAAETADVANVLVDFAQADADVGMNTTTALTNPVYFGGTQNTAFIGSGAFSVGGTGTIQEYGMYGTVAAQKYFAADNQGNKVTIIHAYGYEV